MTKDFSLIQGYSKEDTELKKTLNELNDNLNLYTEHQNFLAKLTRAKYNALLKECFSEKQALELCRT